MPKRIPAQQPPTVLPATIRLLRSKNVGLPPNPTHAPAVLPAGDRLEQQSCQEAEQQSDQGGASHAAVMEPARQQHEDCRRCVDRQHGEYSRCQSEIQVARMRRATISANLEFRWNKSTPQADEAGNQRDGRDRCDGENHGGTQPAMRRLKRICKGKAPSNGFPLKEEAEEGDT